MKNTQNNAVPSQDHVLNSGNALETTGTITALIGILIGLVMMFSTGNPFGFGLIPVGLLVMITGYVKKSAAVNAAFFIIKMHECEATSSVEGRAQGHQS